MNKWLVSLCDTILKILSPFIIVYFVCMGILMFATGTCLWVYAILDSLGIINV
jgi:hypothetical protein